MGLFQFSMRSKPHQSLKLKPILLGFFLCLLLLLLIRSNFSSSQQISTKNLQIPSSNSVKFENSIPKASLEQEPEQEIKSQLCPPQDQPCNKLPQPVMQALIHYATSNITPQQTFDEISITAQDLQRKSPCNFLVFGLGHDSLLWKALNHGGRTVFLEEDQTWIEQMTQQHPDLESYQIDYDTKVREAGELMRLKGSGECSAVQNPRFSECKLSLKNFPEEIYEIEWDLIMVDAPTGYFAEAPGRMKAIYTAGLMARNRREGETEVYVHDADRQVEDTFSRAFLCEGYLKHQEGRLRHFTIPSHHSRNVAFCP